MKSAGLTVLQKGDANVTKGSGHVVLEGTQKSKIVGSRREGKSPS